MVATKCGKVTSGDEECLQPLQMLIWKASCITCLGVSK